MSENRLYPHSRRRRPRRRVRSTRGNAAFTTALVIMGLVTTSASTILSSTAATDAGTTVAEGVADIPYVGVNTSTPTNVSDWTPSSLPYASDLNIEGAEVGVALPSAFGSATFPVAPLKSIHFSRDGVDWYAYVLPTGQGERAADAVMSTDSFWGTWDGFTGALTKFVIGDIVIFASADHVVDAHVMESMASEVAPSCHVSGKKDYRGEDWRRNAAFAGDEYRPLEVAQTVAASPAVISDVEGLDVVADDDFPDSVVPADVISSINKELPEPVPAPPAFPGAEPTPPQRPTSVTVVGFLYPDDYGPGCGWAYTGAFSADDGDYSTMNAENEVAEVSARAELDSALRAYVTQYKEYVTAWKSWKTTRDLWLEYQNKVLQAYANSPSEVNLVGATPSW